jgi:BirA family biotin operon repressor/biotin-[acetyl-CoA-carboxylase] ligase
MSVQAFNPIIKLHSTDSTNNYATSRLVKENWAEGTTVVAGVQLNGKGQTGNSWESETNKNLLTSVVLYPTFLPIQHQFEISKVVALAVLDVVSEYVRNVTIKWPNDIYVGSKKIAGILIENAIMGKEIGWVVAGVGLNVNQTEFWSNAPNPISLAILNGIEYDIDELLNKFLHQLNHWYHHLKKEGFAEIDNLYLNNLYRYHEKARFSDSSGVFTGKIIGVNPFGHLNILKDNGETCSYGFKEVAFLV